MNFIFNFIKGIFIGIGAIAPGVSGGSLAVIFGLYERITDFIANVFKDFKNNVIFFLPIGLGACVGVLGFSRVLEYLFANYNAEVKYLFIGLIVGTLPMVFKQANQKGFKSMYLLILVLSLIFTILITILDNNTSIIDINRGGNQNLLAFVVYGAILGFGTIVPGISASFILMYLGAYEIILRGIADINLRILIPTGIGFVLSIVLFAKLINWLFKKAYGYTYYTVLGFVVGSIIPVFPGFAFSLKYLICVVLMIIGFYISFSLSKIQKA